jgi:hypothetical protein
MDIPRMTYEFKRVHWLRRSLAFIIDLLVLSIVWSVINNYVVVPVPSYAMEIASLALFCGYFAVFEGTGNIRASLGKRIMGIAVYSLKSYQPSILIITLRSTLLCVLIWIHWARLVSESFPSIPYILAAIPTTLLYGIAFYNIWLGLRDKNGIMLQDGVSQTAIANKFGHPEAGKEALATIGSGSLLSRPVLGIVIVLIVLLGASTYRVAMLPSPWETYQGNFALEELIYKSHDIRNTVEITNSIEMNSNEDIATERNLNILVWIPYVTYHEKIAIQITDTVVKNLQIKQGQFDNVKVVISTGIFPIFLNHAIKFPI